MPGHPEPVLDTNPENRDWAAAGQEFTHRTAETAQHTVIFGGDDCTGLYRCIEQQ